MKNISLVLLLLATSGCNQSSDISAASPSKENGWTPRTTNEILNTCKTAIINSGEFTPAYANTYCLCIYGEIIPRWSYSDLQHNELAIIEALANEGVTAKCLQAAHQPEVEVISKTANMAGMPSGFFDVRIGSTAEEVKAKKPRAREKSWGLEDTESLSGEAFNVSYAVNPFSNSVLSISLERQASQSSYMTTNAYLNNEFGPLSTPLQSGHWLLRSERVAGGVELIHVFWSEGPDVTKEKIMLHQAEE